MGLVNAGGQCRWGNCISYTGGSHYPCTILPDQAHRRHQWVLESGLLEKKKKISAVQLVGRAKSLYKIVMPQSPCGCFGRLLFNNCIHQLIAQAVYRKLAYSLPQLMHTIC